MESYWIRVVPKFNDQCPSEKSRSTKTQRRKSGKNGGGQRLDYIVTNQGMLGGTLAEGRSKEGFFCKAFRGSVAPLIP